MGAPLLLVPSQAPSWWFDAWSVRDWSGTLFNQPIEVHTFELGALVGVVLASLIVRRRQRLALMVVLVVGLFTFGALETVFVCSDAYSACQHVQLKPWYFLGGFLVAHLLSLVGVSYVSSYFPTLTEALQPFERPLAELIVVVLLGLAAYSFVSPEPVHPITGLATVGGFIGAVLGFAAFEWASDDDGRSRFRANVRRVLHRAGDDDADLVVAYGTVLGFGYPRLFWELGVQFGKDDFLFGPITWANGGLLSVVTYVFVVFLLGLLLYRRHLRVFENQRLDGARFAVLVLGYVTYTACLFVATGYAERFWYQVIPAAST